MGSGKVLNRVTSFFFCRSGGNRMMDNWGSVNLTSISDKTFKSGTVHLILQFLHPCPGRVRCYGPGVEPSGPVVGAPTHFTIETFSAGKGKVEAILQTPEGHVETVSIQCIRAL